MSNSPDLPNLLSIAAVIIAAFALLVSICSIVVSYLSYRESHPRVKIHASGQAYWPGSEEADESRSADLQIQITNAYGGTIEVDHMDLSFPPFAFLQSIGSIDSGLAGEPLPYELQPRSTRSWTCDLLPFIDNTKSQLHRGGPLQEGIFPGLIADIKGARVTVTLGTSRVLTARVKGLSPTAVEAFYAARWGHNQ